MKLHAATLAIQLLLAAATAAAPSLVPRCYSYEASPETCLFCGRGDRRPTCLRTSEQLSQLYLCGPCCFRDSGGVLPWLAMVEQHADYSRIQSPHWSYKAQLSGPYGDLPSCPVVSAGKFTELTPCEHAATALADTNNVAEFWKAIDCTRHCCKLSDYANGTFAHERTGTGDDWPIQHIWRTHSGCMPLSIRPIQAIPCLHTRGVKRIIAMGDSLLRQMHGRFVTLARKTRTTVDHHTWHNARYRIWRDKDLFEVGGEGMIKEYAEQWFKDMMHPDTRHRVSLRPGGPEAVNYMERLSNTSLEEPLLDVFFIWAHSLEEQLAYWQILHDMAAELGDRFTKSHVITGVWQHYRGPGMELLEEPHRAKFEQLLALMARPSTGIHTTYVVNGHTGSVQPDHGFIPKIREINRRLLAWQANVTSAVIVDFNALSNAAPFKPPQTGVNDFHYGCEVAEDENSAREPCIRPNTHGGCTDTMNTVLIGAMLNHMCNPFMTQ